MSSNKNRPSIDDENLIWKFIHLNVCENKNFPYVGPDLFQECINQNQMSFDVNQIEKFYRESMLSALYKCDLPAEEVLELYKTLEIKVSAHKKMILERRFSARVSLDSQDCIATFSFPRAPFSRRSKWISSDTSDDSDFDGHIPENASPEYHDWRILRTLQISDDMNFEIWNHLFKKSSSLTKDIVNTEQFWDELLDPMDIQLSSSYAVRLHFHHNLLKDLWKQPRDPLVKLCLLKELRVSLSAEQKEHLLQNDGIDVRTSDEGLVESWDVVEHVELQPPPQRRIKTWKPRDTVKQESPSLSRAESNEVSSQEQYIEPAKVGKRSPFTIVDDMKAWDYIYAALKDAEGENVNAVQPKGVVFWDSYIRKTGSSKTSTSWNSHFRKTMCPQLHELLFPAEKMLFLYRKVDIPMDTQIQKILERKFDAQITVNRGHVLSYKINDRAKEASRVMEIGRESQESIAGTSDATADVAFMNTLEETIPAKNQKRKSDTEVEQPSPKRLQPMNINILESFPLSVDIFASVPVADEETPESRDVFGTPSQGNREDQTAFDPPVEENLLVAGADNAAEDFEENLEIPDSRSENGEDAAAPLEK